MSFFSKLPKTSYDFYNTGRKSQIPDLFKQVKVVERRLDKVSIYQKYFIRDERPDQASFSLYGSTDFHWTFMLVNDNLRSAMNKWPLSDLVLTDFIEEKYVGHTITPYREPSDAANFNSIAGQFPIGTVITGSSSGATATVTDRKPNLNQIVFTYDNGSFLEGTDTFTGVAPDTSVYQILNTKYDIRTHPNSAYRYEDLSGNTIINQENLQITTGIVTNTNYEVELNDEYKEIRVIKPEYIQQFASEFRKLTNE